MKEGLLTVRVAASTRSQVEAVARREGRSLSQQVERFITAGLIAHARGTVSSPQRQDIAPLTGVLTGAGVPTLADFAAVRSALSRSLRARTTPSPSRVTPRGRHRR